jgi:hypothetical protein
MSLSHDILEGRLDSVKRRIALGASVNDFDAYGYTPLIMALMTNQPDCAAFLLSKGADPNKPDIFGQPPLHWGIKIESPELCRLLLKRTAFPNTVSAYGEPLLVYPLLRKNQELIDILSSFGTDRNCAQDYIFIKYLGHHFELQGFGCFRNYNNLISLVDYQGFRLEFSVSQILRQYETYLDLNPHKKNQQTKDISEALWRSSQLRGLKKALPSELEEAFSDYLGPLNIIPMAFDGHAVSLVCCGCFIAVCDRAQNRRDTVIFYERAQPLSIEELQFLLYGKKTAAFWESFAQSFNLRPIATLPIAHQKTGNCSWANFELTPILAQALLQLHHNSFDKNILMQEWSEWHLWSEKFLIRESLLRVKQLSSDRKLCYTMTLLDILLQRPDIDDYDLIVRAVLEAEPLVSRLYDQHRLNKSPYLQAFNKIKTYSIS